MKLGGMKLGGTRLKFQSSFHARLTLFVIGERGDGLKTLKILVKLDINYVKLDISYVP
jgi:hypothetical protein